MHIYHHCHKTFCSEMPCVGIAPAASVKPTTVANTVLVEPQFLIQLCNAQQATDDKEMSKFRNLATLHHNDTFYLARQQGVILIMSRNMQGVEQLVILHTNGLRKLLMQELHETAIAGHLGTRKLAHALLQRAWQPKLRQWAARFVQQCPICSRVKDSTTKSPGLLQPLPIPRRHLSSYGIDLMINLPETKEGYNTIMTVTEHLIKHTQFIPCHMGDNELSAV